MNLSDPSDDDSSSEEGSVPSKRPRTDTYGASSTTSHGSGYLQESEDEEPEAPNLESYSTKYPPSQSENSPVNRRLSRSSLSEACASPAEHYDDRPAFDDNDIDNGDGSMRQSFQDPTNSLYKLHSNKLAEYDQVFSADYSYKSKRMMTNMGYIPGKGLGKNEHGRTAPVEASTQKGRRGLGLKPSIVGDTPQNFKWTPDESTPEAKEKIYWLPTPPEEPLSGDILEEWLQRGPKVTSIDNCTDFVEPHILKGVLDAKTIFDSLDDEDLRHARFRSNPYETIGSVIFLNRAAVKMANMDAVLDFMFTNPKKQNGENFIEKNDLLYFADVCAGPGGFSEYVLYRKKWRAKGFGFTLKEGKDFKLSDFYAGTPETFNPYYGVKEDGNIFDPANLMSLKDRVLEQTDDKGVHFLMGDGGFSVEGHENIQEILSKQLYLTQCLAGLMLVRTGGHFLVKLFDVFTMFSVGLIYIMYRCFEKVSIFKPVTSRPANSERYLICMWKKLGTEPAEKHLFSVNSMLWEKRDDDVTELVPLTVIQEDTGFYEYIYRSNCVLGEKQITNLLKIAAFSKDKSLKETSQAAMKKECLTLWHLPDEVRKQPPRLDADGTLMSMFSIMEVKPSNCDNARNFRSNVLSKQPTYLEKSSDLKLFESVYDWHFMFLSSEKNHKDLTMFIGCGGKQVYRLESKGWTNVYDLHINLPAKTLIYGEIVNEYRGESRSQMRVKALHIVDAMILGGVDISQYTLSERINQCDLFCNALNKPFDSQALPIRCKRLFNMENFTSALNYLEDRIMKIGKKAKAINIINKYHQDDNLFYSVESILFLKEIKKPWAASISKTYGKKYYHTMGKDKKSISYFHIPKEARLDMVNGYLIRVMWPLKPSASIVLDGHPHEGLTREDMEKHITCQTT